MLPEISQHPRCRKTRPPVFRDAWNRRGIPRHLEILKAFMLITEINDKIL